MDRPVVLVAGGRARCAVEVAADRIALAGANDGGTLYAAYELIERLGARCTPRVRRTSTCRRPGIWRSRGGRR